MATIDMSRKEGGAAVSLSRGSWVTTKHNVAWAKVYFRTKWPLYPSSRLATIEMGRKLGRGLGPLLEEGDWVHI